MKKDYVVVANGNFLTREIIIEAVANKIIVASDGASTRLAKIGIKPHIILGDFDSIDETKTQQNYWGIKQKFSEIDDKSKPYKHRFTQAG